MGFYFRKSIGSGPFRINFSKSGISYSAGIKGARVNLILRRVSNKTNHERFPQGPLRETPGETLRDRVA
jgi:hypothetical protein